MFMGELREHVEKFYAAFNAGDFDEASTIFAEDVVTTEPALGRANTLNAWRAYGEGFKAACPDATLVLRSAIEEGPRIAVEGSFRGTFSRPLQSPRGEVPPTGRTFDLEFADFFTFNDGKVVEHRVYYDQVDFATQMGLGPQPNG